MSWSSRQQSFYNQMWPLAVDASTRTGIPAQVIFAQSALETGWGQSAPQNNYFGIKGTGGAQQTREYIGGRWVTVSDSFRGYTSMADSVAGYVDFITNPNSQRWTAARNARTPEEAAQALQSGGYATDPNYASKLMSIIRGLPNPFSAAPTQSANQSAPISRNGYLSVFGAMAGNPAAQIAGAIGAINPGAYEEGGILGDGGLVDRVTVSPSEAAGHVEGWIRKALDALGDPAKRVAFVVAGLLLMAISIFVILNGSKKSVQLVMSGVDAGKSRIQSAALEAMA